MPRQLMPGLAWPMPAAGQLSESAVPASLMPGLARPHMKLPAGSLPGHARPSCDRRAGPCQALPVRAAVSGRVNARSCLVNEEQVRWVGHQLGLHQLPHLGLTHAPAGAAAGTNGSAQKRLPTRRSVGTLGSRAARRVGRQGGRGRGRGAARALPAGTHTTRRPPTNFSSRAVALAEHSAAGLVQWYSCRGSPGGGGCWQGQEGGGMVGGGGGASQQGKRCEKRAQSGVNASGCPSTLRPHLLAALQRLVAARTVGGRLPGSCGHLLAAHVCQSGFDLQAGAGAEVAHMVHC